MYDTGNLSCNTGPLCVLHSLGQPPYHSHETSGARRAVTKFEMPGALLSNTLGKSTRTHCFFPKRIYKSLMSKLVMLLLRLLEHLSHCVDIPDHVRAQRTQLDTFWLHPQTRGRQSLCMGQKRKGKKTGIALLYFSYKLMFNINCLPIITDT